jgi:hypothetical protein
MNYDSRAETKTGYQQHNHFSQLNGCAEYVAGDAANASAP